MVNKNGVLDDGSVHFYMRACDIEYAQIPEVYKKMITITPIKGNDVSSFIVLDIQMKIIEILASKAWIAPTLVKMGESSNDDQEDKIYKGNAKYWTFDMNKNRTT